MNWEGKAQEQCNIIAGIMVTCEHTQTMYMYSWARLIGVDRDSTGASWQSEVVEVSITIDSVVKMIGCTDVTFGNSTDKMSQTGQVHPTQKRKNNLEDYLETQPAGQHDYATEHHHSVEQQVLHGQK